VIINESKTTLTISRIFHRICLMRLLLPLSKVITRDIMASIEWLEDARTRQWGNGRGIFYAMVGSIRFWPA
jgi:hypothetical protein